MSVVSQQIYLQRHTPNDGVSKYQPKGKLIQIRIDNLSTASVLKVNNVIDIPANGSRTFLGATTWGVIDTAWTWAWLTDDVANAMTIESLEYVFEQTEVATISELK